MNEYPKLKRLLRHPVGTGEARAKDLAEVMQAAAKQLARGKDVGRLHIDIVGGRRANRYTLEVLDGDSRVVEGATENADLEIVVPEEAIVEIADGTLSPVDAYLSGRMEITGDVAFGKRQYAKLMDRGNIEDLPA